MPSMNNKITFLLKVLLFSLGLSILIKVVGPLLSIPASSAIALVAVCLPSMILGILFTWRARQYPQQPESLSQK